MTPLRTNKCLEENYKLRVSEKFKFKLNESDNWMKEEGNHICYRILTQMNQVNLARILDELANVK